VEQDTGQESGTATQLEAVEEQVEVCCSVEPGIWRFRGGYTCLVLSRFLCAFYRPSSSPHLTKVVWQVANIHANYLR
jgi:hypothetical protein